MSLVWYLCSHALQNRPVTLLDISVCVRACVCVCVCVCVCAHERKKEYNSMRCVHAHVSCNSLTNVLTELSVLTPVQTHNSLNSQKTPD